MKNIKIHNNKDFLCMRKAGLLAAQTLDMIENFIKPGVKTNELDKICHDFIVQNGAIPAPLNYKGFPKSICTSLNYVVCHGIPDETKLHNGDLLNIDVTVILDGWHGDTNRTFFVGDRFENDPKLIKAKRLTKATYESMMIGINTIKPGIKLSEIGKAIQGHVNRYGFSVTRDFCGHGIGEVFHADPAVCHYYGKDLADYSDSITLLPGMFFTVEPMINAGTWEVNVSKIDGWTVTTKDRQLSAQFEHTIGVNETGVEIFTTSPAGNHYPKILDKFDL